MKTSIAWFITPHGFGHTTRTVAVMRAVRDLRPDLTFDVFSTVPAWLFEDLDPIRFHDLASDVGLAQKSALEVDFDATLAALQKAPLFNPLIIDMLKAKMRSHECGLIYCDIAPLGIAVAKEAGVPSVLAENFTWDWIYEGYLEQEPRLKPFIRRMAAINRQADHHIQMSPPGVHSDTASQVELVVRHNRQERAAVRDALHLSEDQPMVLITMGGLAQNLDFVDSLGRYPYQFLIPGAVDPDQETPTNVTFVAHDDSQYHPDLVLAADVVIGKLGYSTVAEVAQAGTPFGFIERYAFRESPVLAQFVQQHLSNSPIAEQEFHNGDWLEQIPDLLAEPRRIHKHTRGADQIANILTNLI